MRLTQASGVTVGILTMIEQQEWPGFGHNTSAERDCRIAKKERAALLRSFDWGGMPIAS